MGNAWPRLLHREGLCWVWHEPALCLRGAQELGKKPRLAVGSRVSQLWLLELAKPTGKSVCFSRGVFSPVLPVVVLSSHTHLTDLMASSVTCDGSLPF